MLVHAYCLGTWETEPEDCESEANCSCTVRSCHKVTTKQESLGNFQNVQPIAYPACPSSRSYLHRDATGTGPHCDRAHLHQEVTILVASTPGLNLAGLGTLEKALELHHEHIEVGVSNKARAILKEGKAAQWVLRVMHHVHQLPSLACKGQMVHS